jgi:hypothetical protein
LLRFLVREFSLGPRNYLLLPKLNPGQVLTIGDRLKERGYVVSTAQSIKARKGRTFIGCDPVGLCWSNSAPMDAILPHIPELLASPKEDAPVVELRRRYFGARRSGQGATIRFRPRLEGGPVWRGLRGSGLCALTPDEHAVLVFLLEHASGPLNVVTDFVAKTSSRRIVNRRQLYDSGIGAALVRSTLSSTETRGQRNSYLPQGGVLRLSRFDPPSKREYVELFESLGEWCYFQPR